MLREDSAEWGIVSITIFFYYNVRIFQLKKKKKKSLGQFRIVMAALAN